jgi:hypothetical protein
MTFGQAVTDVPPELANENPDWLEARSAEIDGALRNLTAAYELDADVQQALRSELWIRAGLRKQYEQNSKTEFARLQQLTKGASGSDSPQIQEALKSLQQMAQSNPLSEDAAVKWIEQRLPPTVVAAGRPRLKEIHQRQQQSAVVWEDDQQRMASRGAGLSRERQGKEALQTFGGQPLPAGEKADEAQAVDQMQMQQAHITPVQPTPPPAQPQKAAPATATHAPTGATARPVRPEQPSPTAKKTEPVYAPAPPLDDWDKYVTDVARKYNFDEAQKTNAMSILQDLRRRAGQYRMSRASQFANAETMKDQKLKSDTLKTLSRPIDALFDELKSRLESLPTVEQKQKATQGNQPAKKPGKSGR